MPLVMDTPGGGKMERGERPFGAKLFGARIGRVALLSMTAILALLGTRTGLTQGTGPAGAVGLSEGMQLEGPTSVVVRELPAAAPTAGQARGTAPRPRPAPQAAQEAHGAAPDANAGDGSFAAQTALAPALSGTGFEGLDDRDDSTVAGFTLTPPDPQVAVGPNHVFEMVNVIGRIYTRAGAPVQTFTLASFFGVPAGFSGTDPRVFYDALSGRWFSSFVSILDLSGSQNDKARLHLAISQTDDPTGAWNVYFVSSDQVFPDYEAIGVTNDKLTVSSNIFDIDGPSYFGVETLVLEKADVLAGLPGASVHLFAFARRIDRFTVRPAQSLSAGTDQFLVTRDRNVATTLTVIKVTGTPAAGNVTEAFAANKTIIGQNAPPASVALGGNIDSGDQRLLDAMWRNGRLWTSASAACVPAGDGTTRSCAHLIEVDTGPTPPNVLEDIMFGQTGQYFSWPALRTDASADLYVSLTHTNSSIFPEARATGRLAVDPPNTLNGTTLLRAGDIAHNSTRWGDYLAVAVDPLFPECVWLVGEYSKDTPGAHWGTFIARSSFSAGCDGDSDGWSDGAELIIGTNPALPCGTRAWPPDINNDHFVDISDVVVLTGNFGLPVPPTPARDNIAPDPPDGFVDITDLVRMLNLFGQRCS
jgi:hypothetical protein